LRPTRVKRGKENGETPLSREPPLTVVVVTQNVDGLQEAAGSRRVEPVPAFLRERFGREA